MIHLAGVYRGLEGGRQLSARQTSFPGGAKTLFKQEIWNFGRVGCSMLDGRVTMGL